MKTIKKINCIREEILLFSQKQESVGFVPTMGALHKGHISLVRKAKKTCKRVVVSIFVNPIQFGENEDLNKYPRPIKNDMQRLESEGVDLLFAPSAFEMYKNRLTKISIPYLSSILCGKKRKNHFDGVLTVVAKLFNIVRPDCAFFGEKDYQQLFLVKKMSCDLDFPVKIISCPIVREPDGLAMSSRNSYLSLKQKKEAAVIYRTLMQAKSMFKNKMKTDDIEAISKKNIESNSSGKVEYVKIYTDELKLPGKDSLRCRIFAAVKFGNTRLIDNMEVKR